MIAWASVRGSVAGSDEYFSDDEKQARLGSDVGRWEVIRRLRIEFQITPADGSPRFARAHRVLALAAPGMVQHSGARYSESLAWQDDPYLQELILRGTNSYRMWPNARILFRFPVGVNEPVLGVEDAMVAVLPTWPAADHRLSRSTELRLIVSEAVRSPNYRLWRVKEMVRNETCWVLDYGGFDRLWISSDRPLCLMRREFRDRGSGRLIERIETEEFGEVGKDLWMPTMLRNQHFARAVDMGTSIEMDGIVRVVDVKTNDDVADSFFNPLVFAGSVELGRDGGFVQVLPGGEDLRRETLQYILRELDLGHRPPLMESAWRWVFLAVGLPLGWRIGGVVLGVRGNRRGMC